MAKQKSLYVFMGPPGSGKGSLSSLCINRLGWKQLSAGNLCRQEIRKCSLIGKQIDFILKSGKLVSDELIAQMVENALCEYMLHESAIILDGFPRTYAQAEALDKLFLKDDFSSLRMHIIRLCILDDTVLKRLSNRILCPNDLCQAVYSSSDISLFPKNAMVCDSCPTNLVKRDDDREDIIRQRLEIYRAHESALVDHYKKAGYFFCDLSVERSLEEVFSDFRRIIGVEYI